MHGSRKTQRLLWAAIATERANLQSGSKLSALVKCPYYRPSVYHVVLKDSAAVSQQNRAISKKFSGGKLHDSHL
jgi:hypothetical protein